MLISGKILSYISDQVPSLTQALLSYLQDANPFNFRPKNNIIEEKNNPIQRYNENNILEEENKVYVTESKIDEHVPLAVPRYDFK